MKLHKLIFTILILFASFQICLGQEKPKAELIAEFGEVGCEVRSAQLDALLINLQRTKNSSGYIVIFGNKNNALQKYWLERLFQNYLIYRKVPNKINNDVVIVHGQDKESVKVELWMIPEGAEKPDFKEERWNYLLLQNLKPFILESKTDYDGSGNCPEFDDYKGDNPPEIFVSKLLLANPNLNAHLVIYSNSTKKFERTKNKLINQFTKTYKIPRNQLKVFYARKTGYVNLEFWLVPKNKRD